ncbi:putative HVA22-like protein g [Andrographis paniculata]|uniref:putative HVA22-like protein g n=1 Tax=Andrographis paniculata TaxID=175694 RepID=UPI0021E741C9|nr:putative HVA22-like protein g [Andrographis paniculata]
MITSFITRGLQLIFGYVYPAYECYKTVELNKPDVEELRFWCQYWILVAGLTVCEKIGDTFIGWVPMYGEAKLAFFIYLWFPKTKGTPYVYNSFFKPYVEKHEPEIDRNLLELKTRAGDMAILSWQKFASYGQTRIFEILQYIASQSPQQSQQQRQNSTRAPKPNASLNRAAQSQDGQLSSSSEDQEGKAEVAAGSSEDPKTAPVQTATNELKTTPSPSIIQGSKASNSNEEQVMQIDSVPPAANDSSQHTTAQDMILDDAAEGPRARPRRARAAYK